MERRSIASSGPEVGLFTLGTMTFGVETDEAAAHEQLDRFVEAGGTCIDTADVYGAGSSEEIVGRWLRRRGRRDELVVATKGRFATPDGEGASRGHLTTAADASLRRLGIDHLDLYWIHGWDDATPVAETLEALADLARTGKIVRSGWSNVTGWQLQRILRTAEALGVDAPIALQPQYNLLDRGIEWELLPQCLEEGLGVFPWSPLGGGWLTGKYRPDERPSGPTRLGDDPERGVEAYDLRNNARTWRVLDVVERIAGDLGTSPAAVALAWVRDRPGVASVILGARTLEQLEQNLVALDVTLDADASAALTEVSAPGLPPYPYGMVERFCGVTHWQRLGTSPPSA